MLEKGTLSGDWPHVWTPNTSFRFIAGTLLAAAGLLVSYDAGIPAPRIGESVSVILVDTEGIGLDNIPRQHPRGFNPTHRR